MVKKLIIVGAGGHGKVVAETALKTDLWDKIIFLDDDSSLPKKLLSIDIAGKISELKSFRNSFSSVVVAIGNPIVRLKIFQEAQKMGFELPAIIDPSAVVSKFSDVGDGSVIFANAVVQTNASIGNACIVNTSASIDHDCIVQTGSHIGPGAHICGGVKVGTKSLIGVGCSVIPQITIGDNVTIGAGAAVVSNIEDNSTVLGVPAKPSSTNC